jgi:hypothetical protein
VATLSVAAERPRTWEHERMAALIAAKMSALGGTSAMP